MSERIIHIGHHVDDYECMWNGIEDLYIEKSGEKIPAYFFFTLAGTGNFIYRKTPGGSVKRQAVWNDGRTKKMYERLAPIAGFRYRHIEGKSFSAMLKQAKQSIDKGDPVVLGCLDMYFLAYYPKFFQREHIPTHYVLMIGYDDGKQCIYVLDCGIAGVQEISYVSLEEALDVQKTDLSGKNAMCLVKFEETLRDIKEIASRAFAEKARNALNPPVSFLGISGMRKLAKEFEQWQTELSLEEYQAALRNIVIFTGEVPSLPDAFLRPEERNGINHMAAREKLAHVLEDLSSRYRIDAWGRAAKEFIRSGDQLARMTDIITDFLLGSRAGLTAIPEIISEIADIEEQAFLYMLDGAAHCG
jgi:hypothetical protein